MTESKDFDKDKDPEFKTYSFNEMVSEKCFNHIFNDEVVSNELIAVVGCMKDKIYIETFGI